MVTIYPNYGHTLAMIFRNNKSSQDINKRSTVNYKSTTFFILSQAYYLFLSLLREVLVYHNGYYIPKLWACVSHGTFLAIVKQVIA